MKRILSIFGASVTLVLCMAPAAAAQGQSQASAVPRKIVLQAEVKPGQVLRYELEAAGSFLPTSDASGAILTPPRGPCDYALAAIVTLRPQAPNKDGNIPVEAKYSETRVMSVRCALFAEADFQKRLAALQSAPVMFRVGPHGETALGHTSGGYFKYWDGGDLLRKVTQDLLQTEFSPQPVAEGASWKPRGQFAYSRDHALKALELSGADLRFKNMVQVDGKSCAWVTSQYVFSPIDLPAVGTASGGRIVPAAGNNAVAAVLHISLLLDPASHHVAWLHRSQTIDNKLTLASPFDDSAASDDPVEPDDQDSENPMPDLSSMRSDNPGRYPFMTFHFQEEARARLLPDERSVEWLAALKKFEGTPEPESGTVPVPVTKTLLPNPIVQAAKPAVVKRTTRVVVDSESLVATPAGFTRYEKGLCRDAWFCATVSVALPGDVQISEDTPLRTIYLAQTGTLHVSIAVGPALDRRGVGLTEEEELRKQANYYLDNYVWLAAKPGIGTSSTSATLDGYPGLVTDFSATQRDLANIHGVLGLILTPWGKVVPVSCSSDHASSAELQTVCEKVITSVSLRR
ncbi:MAG TPA: hypothetical protein VFE61_22935 [Candidatus Sulfotelmatobacter sp.]|nr:hypothetical protein [Candidatus Sulfotelmatobacter sp.]